MKDDKKVQSADPQPPAPPVENRDVYVDRIIKFIPGPILAAYAAASGMISEDPAHIILLSWIVFGVCILLAPLYVVFIPGEAQDNKNCSKRFHVFASIISFAIWAYALGGPFALTFPEHYRPLYGSLLLIFATLILPLMQKILMLVPFFKHKPE
jgi:hypothetical protein